MIENIRSAIGGCNRNGIGNLLLAILFGAAAGNVGRGVPVDAQGNFSMAFFTTFGIRGNVGLIDWYTVSVAIFTAVLLAAHGATYLMLKTEGPVHDRSESLARRLWVATAPLLIAISIESWVARPDVAAHAVSNLFCWVGLFLVVGSAIVLFHGLSTRREMWAFAGSNLFIVALLVTGGAAIFPVMLYSTLGPQYSLTAYNMAAGITSLRLASIWWPVAFALALGYFVFISRRYAGKIGLKRDNQGFY